MDKKILTKDEILKAEDIQKEFVDVPEWGGSVYVKMLTGKERDQLESSVITGPGQRDFENLRAKLIALSVVDENGTRLFDFNESNLLGDKSARVLDRLFSVAQRLSGITAKDVDDITKKSGPAQESDSSSD